MFVHLLLMFLITCTTLSGPIFQMEATDTYQLYTIYRIEALICGPITIIYIPYTKYGLIYGPIFPIYLDIYIIIPYTK